MLYVDWHYGSTNIFFDLYSYGSLLSIPAIVFVVIMNIRIIYAIQKKGKPVDIMFFFSSIMVLLAIPLLWGPTYGYLIKRQIEAQARNPIELEVKKSNNETEILVNMSIIMFLQHHAVFANKDVVFVIPTADIVRMSISPKAEKKH